MRLPPLRRLLDPTRSLRARLGLFFGGLSLTLAILIAIILGNTARRHAERSTAESLSSAAANMSYILATWLGERYEDIHVLAQLPPMRDPAEPADRARILNEYRRDYPAYAWLGLLSRDDHLLASTKPDLSRPPLPLTNQPYIGSVRSSVQNAKPLRVLDLVVPVNDSQGATWAKLQACLDWQWAESVQASLEKTLPPGQQENIIVAQPDGTVLLGPSSLPHHLPRTLIQTTNQPGRGQVLTWPDGKSYLTAVVRGTSLGNAPDFPYLVIARQPTALAFAGPRQMERMMAAGGIAVGLVFAALGWALASRIARPLTAIAIAAERMRTGEPDVQIPPIATRDEVGGLAASLRNLIAELHTTQSQLASARDDAESASRAKDRFLAVLSHELRTPLTPILIALSQIDLTTLTPDLRHDLEMIRRNADLEARLIDDLLDTTRIASGKLRLNRQPTDIHAILRYAIDTCLPDARAKNITILAHPDAPHHHASADPARLEQILWNLLKNAIKFTPQNGTITLRTTNQFSGLSFHGSEKKGGRKHFPSFSSSPSSLNPEPLTAENSSLQIQISDTGIGIPPESLPHIFHPFEQGNPHITSRFGGLGLGLAISKSLAESHGGSLSASSPGPHQGSTFTLTLPALSSTLHPLSTPPSSIPQSEIPTPQSLSILLVEDHRDTALLLARLLRKRGHHVTTASSVADALSAAQSSHFDIVISDLGLPDGSGADVMRGLLSLPHPPRGIAVSGYGTDADKQQTHDAGFSVHLTKPIRLTDLEPHLHP
ncbi:MAG TPA: ATP-binding protein [Tepidisphaeraceae bacterium]|jgi:signal transduction histidine kinase|nr:ATP-binding protein [Tepidisphaeraceae bacterium]